MPASAAAVIVARFLKANHYTETFQAFIQEAGLSEEAGDTKPGDWTIEQVLKEKTQFDSSLAYEKTGLEGAKGWTANAPYQPNESPVTIGANVLCVTGNEARNLISVTCADRTWNFAEGASPFKPLADAAYTNDSPVLSTQRTKDGLLLSTSMSGQLVLRDDRTHQIIDECRHHTKYAVQVVSAEHEDRLLIATAGWDQKIQFYAIDRRRMHRSEDGNTFTPHPGLLREPLHVESLPSNPESLIFVHQPDTEELYLVASRRDSTHLYYYRLQVSSSAEIKVQYAGRQNLAPHSNAWVAFTPCSLKCCPVDPTLIAVATSHLPHMRLIIVRLLFPNDSASQAPESASIAAAARANLALQDREDAAISLHITTMAPQTPYSTPQVVWRPDGSGLFVNGDDGVVRGIEATTGKIISLLKGHDPGSKVRTLWAGKLEVNAGNEPEEVLLSGGFDRKMLIWTA